MKSGRDRIPRSQAKRFALVFISLVLSAIPWGAGAQEVEEVFADGFEIFDSQVIFAGEEAEFDLTALAEGDDPATFSYSASPLPLPANALLEGSRFAFRPGIEQVGTFEFVFSASRAGEPARTSRAQLTVLAPPADGVTGLSGRLMDANAMADGQAIPIIGATVQTLDGGASTVTDAEGRFVLQPIPDGELVLDIDSTTAEDAPDGSTYASFREPVNLVPRIANQLQRPIYLPRVDPNGSGEVDPASTTIIENPALGVALEIPPGTARNPDGSNFDGVMSISEVPVEFSPRELPREIRPSMLLTIQPTGVRFSQPVPLVFPNDDGMPPGSETNIWSLDPDSGRFIIVGRGRVSDDGALIETVEGGVRTASWHAGAAPAPIQAPPAQVGENPDQTGQPSPEQECPSGSTVGMQSGCLGIRHTVPAYSTFGISRDLTLSYKSQTAYPNPVINVETSLGDNTAVPLAYGIELLDVAGIAQDFRAFSGAQRNALRQAVRFDASALPTGRYPYTLMLDSEYPLSRVGNRVTGNVLVNNLIESPIGAGWQLDAVSRLVRTEGAPLLREPDGALKLFGRAGDDAFPSIRTTEATTDRIAAGDFNGDSRPDVALGSGGTFSFEVRLAAGNGTFSDPVSVPTQIRDRSALETADFNADGLDDLVVGEGSSSTIEVFIAAGSGEFEAPVTLTGGGGTLDGALAIADFNADGLLDIASANWSSDDVAVFIATAPNAFQPAVLLPAGNRPENIAAADLDADGDIDLIVDNRSSEDVSVFLGNGDGTFAPEQRRAIPPSTGGCLELTDVDRDGSPDLISIDIEATPRELLVHSGDGAGDFGAPNSFPLETKSRRCKVTDLNNDGLIDVAVSDSGEQVSILLGNQAGALDEAVSYSGGNSLDDLAVGDFDGDSFVDVLVAASESMNLLQGNGDGTLVAGRSSEYRDPGSVSGLATANIFPDRLADFDGDGIDDLVVVRGSGTNGQVLVLRGDGSGGFEFLSEFDAPGPGPQTALDIGDLNNDGLMDVVITNDGLSDYIRIYSGNGDGTFGSPSRFGAGNSPQALTVADANADGNLDVLVANFSDLSLRLGNGDGTLGGRQSFPLDDNDFPEDVAIADLDGDGNADLVAVSAATDSIVIAWSTGQGQFDDPVAIGTGDRPLALAIDDLDDDGIPDIVTANDGSEAIFVHFGRGGRRFDDPIVFAAGSRPEDIVLADLDASGTLDIAVANNEDSSITIISNNGDGSWDTGTVVTGTRVQALIDDDIDGDGRVDLLAMTSQTASFLGNRTQDGVWAGPPGDFSTLSKLDDGGFVRRFPDGTVDRFDGDGRQTDRTLASGRQTRYEYDGSGRLRAIIDPAEQRTELRYFGDRLSEITDPSGRTTRLTHDAAGNLIRIINPDGTERAFAYDGNHLLQSQTDARGNTTEYAYDETGRLTGSVLPDGAGRQAAPAQTTALPADPGSTSRDNPAPAVPPGDVVGAFIDAKDRMVTFRLDGLGAAVESTDPLLRTTEIARNRDSLPIRIVRPNGAVQTRSYDRNGNLLTLTETDINATSLFEYEPDFNRLTRATDPLGNSTRFEYDDQGNLITAVDADGVVDTIQYGEPACPGLPTEITVGAGTPSAATSTIAYDPDTCNPTSATDPLGRQVTREYDAAGNLVRLVDAEGRVHRWAYDVMNRVEKIIDASNSNPSPQCGTTGVTCIDYDAAGNVVQVTDPRGGQIGFVYDERNRVVSRTDANGATAQFEYDAEDNLIRTIDRKGQEITFDYDAADRLIEKVWLPGTPGEETITLEYDVIDNLTGAIDADSILTRTYDPIGRLLTESANGSPTQPNVTLSYSYDEAGNRTQLSGPVFTSDYAYDQTNRLISLSAPSGGLFEFSYDALDRRIGITRPNNVTTSAVFDAASQLVNLAHQRQGDAEPFAELTYGYDGVGNVTSLDQDRPILDLQPTLGFGYDSEDQLVQATNPFMGNPDETFQYDPAGNRLLRDGESFSAIHDDANRLLENEDFCFSYDLNGNLLTKQQKIGGACSGATTEYTYNPENQLVQVAIDGNVIADYRYDALGRRIQKETTMGTQKYVYDGADIVLEYDGSDTLQAHYLHSLNIDEPLLMRRDQDADGVFEPAENFYYTANRLGSILELTREDGTVAQSYVYQGFGETTVLDGSGLEIDPLSGVQNPYAFTAREFEPITGLYYYRARYYSSIEGKFIQEDPIGLTGGDTNLYTYVRNNPYNRTDPLGERSTISNSFNAFINSFKFVQEFEKGFKDGRENGGPFFINDEFKFNPFAAVGQSAGRALGDYLRRKDLEEKQRVNRREQNKVDFICNPNRDIDTRREFLEELPIPPLCFGPNQELPPPICE